MVACAVLARIVEQHRRRLKASRFADREPIEAERLVATYFANDNDTDYHNELIYWWKKAASILGIDARLLRPTDRFDCELAPVPGFSLTEDELVEMGELIDEIDPDHSEGQKYKPETLGDYVEFLARCTKRCRRPTKPTNEAEKRTPQNDSQSNARVSPPSPASPSK